MRILDLKDVKTTRYFASSTCNCGSCNCNCGGGSACHNKCAAGETVNLKKEVEKIYKK